MKSSAKAPEEKAAKATEKSTGKPSDKILRLHKHAVESRKNSYSPYSKFKVGAALLTSEGRMFGGANVENASYGATICAERIAILKAVSEGYTKFSEMVIVTDSETPAFPCGECLQMMAEFLGDDSNVWLGNTKEIVSQHEFIQILPNRFGPKSMGLKAPYES